jgi:parallel beta-helix repeat protein
MHLCLSDFCVVTYNLLQENVGYGVHINVDSANNLIHHNSFVDNNLGGTSQAYDNGTTNTWYDTATLEGNCWSDWSGTGSYSIDGSAGSVDLYPLDCPPSEPSLTPHDPISITSDSDLEVFPGSGTAEDPYLIEGYNISTTSTNGILINGTTKFFVVRNCYVDADTSGILIWCVADGTATIENNTCSNNILHAIDIYYSVGSTVTHNNCNNNNKGIHIFHSSSSTVTNNICNNSSGYDIFIGYSSSSTVANNSCSESQGSGIRLYYSDGSTVTNNTCNNNAVGGITLYGSDGSTVTNNTCNNNNFGIRLYYSDGSNIANNTCNNNNLYGIYLYNSSSYISYNLLQENVEYGIDLVEASAESIIHHNNFVDNNLGGISQANDDGVNNYWYDSSINEGNYWSDWSGTGSYAIDGTAGAIDLYPLDYSPSEPLLIPHAPIVITSDIGFEVFPGSGTAEDPYLIEGYNITTTDSIGIYIADTTKYFVIRNCYVDANDYGIYIATVDAGTALIISNTCNNNNLRGIYIYESSSSTVANNTCINNGEYGIYLGDSVSSTVSNNTCSNNNLYGIYLDSSGSSTVANNFCSYNNDGILLYWSVNSDVTKNMCNNNDDYGIYLYASTSSTVSNNTCSYNNGDGIFLEYSGLSTVIYNTCNNNNNRGIFLYDSACSVTYNILWRNVGYGVYLSGSDNDFVHHNNFVDNNLGGTSQAYDDGSNHLWYDTVTLEGNFWSDWSGTGSYAIDGSAGAVDLYPLDEPTVFLGPPVITTVIHSPSTPTELDTISITAIVASPYGVQSVALHYRVNGGTWMEVSMILISGDLYSVTIGSFAASVTIEYYVSAVDNSIDNNESTEDNGGLYYTIIVGSSDVTGQIITGVVHSPSTPTELENICINASIAYASGIYTVTLHYRVNVGIWT